VARLASKITYNDLTGGLNNVDSVEKINSSVKKTETPDMVNVEFYGLGGIKSMEGNQQIGDTQTSQTSGGNKIVGGWEYGKGNNKYMIIALKDGSLKILNNVSDEFDLIYKFAHSSERVSFCNINNGVVATNGIDDPVFYEYGRHQILSGTVSITTGSTSVSGTSTKFTEEVLPGDTIEIDNNVYYVSSVTDDTNLTLRTASLTTSTNKNYYLSTISECNATLVNSDDADIHTPIRGKAIAFYNGRLWIGTENGLYYSQVGHYNKWDIKYDAGVLYSIYNDSSEIKALGLYASYMMVHKEYYTYILTATGDSSTIEIKPYSNISCDSQQSFINANAKYYVYSRELMDIYPLLQRSTFSDKYLGDSISNKVRDIFPSIREADLNNIFCVTLPRKRYMIFYMPMVDRLGSSYGLIYNFQTKSFIVRKVPQEVTIAFNFENNVYIGTSNGKVLKEFTGNTFDGEPIISYYKSPWFDWSDGYTQSFSEFGLEIDNSSNNKFYIRTFKDGSSPYEDRLIDTDALTGEALIWDGEVGQDLPNNDTVWDEDKWVSGSFDHLRMLLPNNVFDKFQLEIGTTNIGDGFSIIGYGFRRIETDEAPW